MLTCLLDLTFPIHIHYLPQFSFVLYLAIEINDQTYFIVFITVWKSSLSSDTILFKYVWREREREREKEKKKKKETNFKYYRVKLYQQKTDNEIGDINHKKTLIKDLIKKQTFLKALSVLDRATKTFLSQINIKLIKWI